MLAIAVEYEFGNAGRYADDQSLRPGRLAPYDSFQGEGEAGLERLNRCSIDPCCRTHVIQSSAAGITTRLPREFLRNILHHLVGMSAIAAILLRILSVLTRFNQTLSIKYNLKILIIHAPPYRSLLLSRSSSHQEKTATHCSGDFCVGRPQAAVLRLLSGPSRTATSSSSRFPQTCM